MGFAACSTHLQSQHAADSAARHMLTLGALFALGAPAQHLMFL